MFNLKACAVAATIAIAPAVGSAAILDDFGVDQTVADAPIGSIPSSSTIGNRTFTVNNRSASAPFDASLVSGGDDDILKFSNQSGVSGFARIDYSLGGVDLSWGGALAIDLLSFDLNDMLADLAITVNGVTSARSIGDEDIGTLRFDFDSFVGVDFANVTSISIFLDAEDATSLDASFDDFRVAPVPVPAAGLLLVGGLGALASFRRRTV